MVRNSQPQFVTPRPAKTTKIRMATISMSYEKGIHSIKFTKFFGRLLSDRDHSCELPVSLFLCFHVLVNDHSVNGLNSIHFLNKFRVIQNIRANGSLTCTYTNLFCDRQQRKQFNIVNRILSVTNTIFQAFC